MGIREDIEALVHPIKTKIANAITRAVVSRVDDSLGIQSVQIGALADEDIDDGERFQEYGFTSVPVEGAEAVAIFPNGDRAHPLVIAVDDRRYRITGLAAGEVAIYNDQGASVTLKANGDIVCVPSGSGRIKLGSASSSDPVALKSDVETLRGELNSHTHTTTATVSTGSPGVLTAPDQAPFTAPVGSSKANSE